MGAETPNDWRLARFRDFLKESRMAGSDGLTAKKITVRLYGKGVVASVDPRPGSAATRYFRRRAGQLIYSKLDFLNGAIGIIPPELDGYESTLDLPCFDICEGVDPVWLAQYMARPAFYLRYRGSADGSRVAKRVGVEELLASRIKLPALPEQRSIARVLRTGDNLRLKTLALAAHLETAKFWTMRRLLTDGCPRFSHRLRRFRESWPMGRVAPKVEAVPAPWPLVRLTDVARLESGHTPSRTRPDYWNGGIPWISLQDTDALEALEITETRETVSDLGIQNSSARVLPAGTVVFSRTASVGLCSRMGRPMATSQDYANYVCGEALEPRYLVQLLRHMQPEWERLQEGSTHKTIYMPVFEKLQILLPPREEQAAIAAVGEAFDHRIAAERAYLEQLHETKRGLAQALLSGRVRVPPQAIDREEA
jgi:type I restriction enzyme S subunit